jgi:tetratricopeptide (TPR) repeat protein
MYFRKGVYDEAIADVSRAIELSPKMWVLYENRGLYYSQKGQLDKALADYNTGLSHYKDSLAFCNRGRILNAKERFSDALDDLNQALKIDKTSNCVLPNRGDSYFGLERYSEAAQDYERYLQTSPEDRLRNRNLGMSYFKLGQLDRARAIAQGSIEYDPRLEKYFSGEHALELFDLDRRRAAVKDALAKAAAAETADSWTESFAEYERAYSFTTGYTADDIADGNKAYEGILRVYPKLQVKPILPENGRRRSVQAETYLSAKDYLKCIEAYRKLLRVAPWYPRAWFNLAFLEGEQQLFGSASADMKVYLKLVPDAPDARAAQDKIYEWEAKAH